MEKKGNNPFNNLTRDEFYKYYVRDISPLINFYYLITKHNLTLSKPLNILIGANNVNENDYNKFTNSPFSLFIDIMNLQGIKKQEDYSIEVYDKQYDMYTLFSNATYNTMQMMINLFRKIGKFVDNYYVDMMTAYFLPRNDYMKLIINTLKPGGKFIFEHTEHQVNSFTFENGVLKGLNGSEFTPKYLKEHFKIDHDSHTTEIINTDVFNDNDLLAPSFPIKIKYIDGNEIKYYKDNLYTAYYDYLAKTYPMFNVEFKTYTYSNYTYPVPLNIIHEPIIIFTYKNIMTLEEQELYVKEKKISQDKINEFAHRLLYNDKLHTQLSNLNISPFKKGNVKTFREDLLNAFNKILYYYELTMRDNIGANYQVKYLKYKNKYLQLKNYQN
jgi:hypothetical protein